MKIIFFGSDDFATAHLKALIDSKHEVTACVTQPDRPKGRGMKIVISKIKEYAQMHNIPVLQPATLKDDAFVEKLADLQADVFVVIAYGRFLPKNIYDMPVYGAINVHPSLLPKYRGAAPINWALINGDKETGISIIRITQEMDAGDILGAVKLTIDPGDTAITLREKMMSASPELLGKTLDDLAAGRAKQKPQDDDKATLAPKLIKELGRIQWNKKSDDIYNLVRGSLPWPSAYTSYNGKNLKVLEASVAQGASDEEPGTVLDVGNEGIVVATGDGGLLMKKVHLQDSKPMEASAFVRGHELEVGFQFG